MLKRYNIISIKRGKPHENIDLLNHNSSKLRMEEIVDFVFCSIKNTTAQEFDATMPDKSYTA